jgi:hypothetical protein
MIRSPAFLCSLVLLAAPSALAAPLARYYAHSGKVTPEHRYQIQCSIFPKFVRYESKYGVAEKTTNFGKIKYTPAIPTAEALRAAIETAADGKVTTEQNPNSDVAGESYQANLLKTGAEPVEVPLRSDGAQIIRNLSKATAPLVQFIAANCISEAIPFGANASAPVLASYTSASGFVDPEKQYSISCEIRATGVTQKIRNASGKETKSEADVLPTEAIPSVAALSDAIQKASQGKFYPVAGSTDGPAEAYRGFLPGMADAPKQVLLLQRGPGAGLRKSPAAQAVVEFIAKNCELKATF